MIVITVFNGESVESRRSNFQVAYKYKKKIVNQVRHNRDNRENSGLEKREREIEAQASVYVIQPKSRSFVKGSVGEPKLCKRISR